MSRIEILNSALLRSDGRRQFELRTLDISLSPAGTADGAATVSHGLTAVSTSVFGPREAKSRRETMHDRANVNVEVVQAPFSEGQRRRRGRGDKRIQELCSMIESTFEPVIHTHLYPRSQIDIVIHILTNDGSLLSACVNATTMALISAGIPMSDFVSCTSVGLHSTYSMLDLTTLEENDIPHVTVAILPKTGKVVLVNSETRLAVERFAECLNVGGEAGAVIHREMRRIVKRWASGLLENMGSNVPRPPDAMDED